MPDALLRRRGRQVVRGRREEVQHRVIGEGRRIGDVDERVGAGQRVGQTRPGEHVDTGVSGRGDDLVAVVLQDVDDLAADEATGPSTAIFIPLPSPL